MTAHFGKSTNIYVIGVDILYQIHKLFEQVFDQKIGIVGDGNCQIEKINIISIWTVGIIFGMKTGEISSDLEDDDKEEKNIDLQKIEDIKKMLSSAKVHIFDECHSASTATISTIAKNIAPEHIYGFSASPFSRK